MYEGRVFDKLVQRDDLNYFVSFYVAPSLIF